MDHDGQKFGSDRGAKIVIFTFLGVFFVVIVGFLGAVLDRSVIPGHASRELIRNDWKFQLERHELQDRAWSAKFASYERKEIELARKLSRYELEVKKRQEAIEQWERELDEKIATEKRERERMRLYWTDIKPATQCLGKGLMKYSARLANLETSIDAVSACKATPITINGITYNSPEDRDCEDLVRVVQFYFPLTWLIVASILPGKGGCIRTLGCRRGASLLPILGVL